MIRQTFSEAKPIKRSAQHTDEQALKKTLSLQSLAFFFQYEKHDKDMEQLTIDLLLRICHCLKKHHVEYLVVGGTAVGFYGHIRMSHATIDRPNIQADLDFWYNPTHSNRKNLAKAILDMGLVLDQQSEKEIQDFGEEPQWDDFLPIEQANYKLDFIPTVKGLEFDEAYKNMVIKTFADVPVHFIGYNDLIKSKELANRPGIDDLDVKALKQIRKKK